MNGCAVSWPLCDAVARAQARRLCRPARTAPLPTALALCAWVFSGILIFRVGSDVGEELSPLVSDPRLARMVVVGLALPGCAGGAALGLMSRGVEALGAALAAAPLARVAAHGAVVAPRFVATFLLAAPLVLAAVLPLSLAAPGGVSGALGLLVALGASASVGALLAESTLHLVRRQVRWVADSGALAAAVCMCGVCELVTRGLVGGTREALLAVAAGLLVGSAAGVAWVVGSSDRPAPRPRRHGGRRPLWRVLSVVDASAFAAVTRAADIRLAMAAAAFFGLGAIAVGALAVDVDGGLVLASGVAAMGAGVAPLSAGGRIDVARWVWSAGPASRVAVAWAGATALAMLVVVGPVVVIGVASGADGTVAVQATALAISAWAAGLAAGALVPRRAADLGDDAASLAAFVAVLSLGVAGGATVHTWLEGLGVPGAVSIWLLLAGGCGIGGLLLVGRARHI